jgi:pilus assembly protein Flp/PilA
MLALVRRFSSCASGSTAIEYALIASMISITIIVGATGVGTQVTGMYDSIQTALKR